MKVLHVNSSDIGSTGKIIQDICREANRRGWEAVTLFPRRNRQSEPNVKEYITSLPFEQGVYRRFYYLYGLHYGFAPLSTKRILRIIQKEKPDIVHLHSINCATVNIYRLVSYLNRKQIGTVVTNHAEFFYTGNCPHAYDCEKWRTGCGACPDLFAASDSKLFDRTHTAWLKMKKVFQGHKKLHIVSVSPWVYARSKQSPILREFPQRIVLNGANTEYFQYTGMSTARSRLGLNESGKIVLHVTANFSDAEADIKGGRYLLELARRLRYKNIRFIVIGRHGALYDIPENVTMMGEIRDPQILALHYCAADLCLVVSKRETFGMTVAEALCCGTPVIGFASGGSESIALPEYTQFVPFGDVDALEKELTDKWILFKSGNDPKEISEKASDCYAANIMAGKYCDLYEEMLR